MVKDKKDKEPLISLILSIVFGPLGWLYTYRVDYWKFWINIILCVITCGLWGIVAWVWAIVDSVIKIMDKYG